jgi:hypothetical protein
MLSKPAGGKQPTPQLWPSPPEMAPYSPHMKSNFRRIRVGLIGDNALSKQICFSLAMSRSNALKMLRWCGDDGDKSRLASGAF